MSEQIGSEQIEMDETRIGAYLNKRLSPEEEIAFETEMLDNAELTRHVILGHSLQTAFRQSDNNVYKPKWRVKAASVIVALAASIMLGIFMPSALVSPDTVSPGIVYLEDFRSHVTEPVVLRFVEGEKFKVVVSDAPPGLHEQVQVVLSDEQSRDVCDVMVKPNDNSEITLLVNSDDVEAGRYQLTLLTGGEELNRFMLEVMKE